MLRTGASGGKGVTVGKGTGVSTATDVAVGTRSGVEVSAGTGVWVLVGGVAVGGGAPVHDDSKTAASKHRSPPKVSQVASRTKLVRKRELGNNEGPHGGTRYYHGARQTCVEPGGRSRRAFVREGTRARIQVGNERQDKGSLFCPVWRPMRYEYAGLLSAPQAN